MNNEYSADNMANSPEVGHRERFFEKLSAAKVERVRKRRIIMNSAVSAAVLLISVTAVFIKTPTDNPDKTARTDYREIMAERSNEILVMSQSLCCEERETVLSVIDQLVNEPVSIEDQLPDNLERIQREIILHDYYSAKLEGMDELKNYVVSML